MRERSTERGRKRTASEPTDRSTSEGSDRSTGDDEYVCEVCGKTFPSEEELGRHVREAGLAN